MKPILLLTLTALLCAPLSAASIAVTAPYATSTMVVVQYTATTSAACTLAMTDNNSGPPVNDVDASKFTGANLDLSRTVANGFRWPTLVNGLIRTVFLGGHDEVKQGLDTAWYSTALQVNSDHTISVSCNGGADTGTVHAQTQNVPIASYYPELMIPQPAYLGEGSWPQPTIDWSVAGRATKYVDPITGVLIGRVTGPTDNTHDGDSYTLNASSHTFLSSTALLDPTSSWTTPDNIYASNWPPTQFASTSTVNAPLFLPLVNAGTLCCSIDIADFGVQLWGHGTGTEDLQMCWSQDSGQTCATGNIDVTLAATSQCQTYLTTTGACEGIPNTRQGSNGNWPTPYWTGWGGGMATTNAPNGYNEMTSASVFNVSASGSTITQPNAQPGFNMSRKPGTAFYLSGCSVGGPVLLHIASVDAYNQITAQESGLSMSGCTFQELAVGLKVTLKSAGTAAIAVRVMLKAGMGTQPGTTGVRWMCARAKVNDIQTDCDGNSRSPALSGQLCAINGIGIYLLQDNGRVCLQGDTFGGWPTGHVAISDSNWVSASSLVGTDSSNAPVVLTHVANNYREYDPGSSHNAGIADRFTYSAPGRNDLPAQILASSTVDPEVKKAINSGLWGSKTTCSNPPCSFDLIIDTPTGGLIQWRLSALGGGGDGLAILAWTDSDGNLIGAKALWNNTNGLASSAVHQSPFGIGGYSQIAVTGLGKMAPAKHNATTVLGGPFITRGTALHKPDGTFHTWPLPAITGVASASPLTLNFAAITDLDPSGSENSNNQIYTECSGGTGYWANLNGVFYLHNMNNGTADAGGGATTQAVVYSDALGSTAINAGGWGSVSGVAPTCYVNPPVWAYIVSAVTSAPSTGTARLTIDPTNLPVTRFNPSHNLFIQDGDSFVLWKYSGWNTPYYAKKSCSGCAWNQIDVYTNPDLAGGHALPYSYAIQSATTGQAIAYAETCPDPATVDMSWAWSVGDSVNIGTAGNPLARCVTIRINSEPCSGYASSGEQSSYPCPSDAGNTSRSSLHAVNIGDSFQDLAAYARSDYELGAVIKKVVTSPTQIDVTLMRLYGDQTGYGASNNLNNYVQTAMHAPGWTLWQTSTYQNYAFDVTQSNPDTLRSNITVGHNDMGYGATDGNLSFHGCVFNCYDSIVNAPVSNMFNSINSSTHNDVPVWAGDSTHPWNQSAQAYTNGRQVRGMAAASDFNWSFNWLAMNPDAGDNPNAAQNIFTRTLTKIRGQTWDLGNTTNIVYKIQTAGTPAPKLFPMLVVNGTHGYLSDKSGPSSLITDADIGKYCVAYAAGECRPNSVVGDVFIAAKGFYDPGYCYSDSATMANPCAAVIPPYAGWAIQMRENPLTMDGNGVRRITFGWHAPMEHYDYQFWAMTGDAKWGLFTVAPVGGRPRYHGAESMHEWVVKLPPWPAVDTVNRTGYVNIPITVGAAAGDQVRIAFGYAENGDPAQLYCTTRQEMCWTSSSPTSGSPFLYAGETQSPITCGTTCTVAVPGIPGRLVYTQLEITHGGTPALGPLTATSVDGLPPVGSSGSLLRVGRINGTVR